MYALTCSASSRYPAIVEQEQRWQHEERRRDQQRADARRAVLLDEEVVEPAGHVHGDEDRDAEAHVHDRRGDQAGGHRPQVAEHVHRVRQVGDLHGCQRVVGGGARGDRRDQAHDGQRHEQHHEECRPELVAAIRLVGVAPRQDLHVQVPGAGRLHAEPDLARHRPHRNHERVRQRGMFRGVPLVPIAGQAASPRGVGRVEQLDVVDEDRPHPDDGPAGAWLVGLVGRGRHRPDREPDPVDRRRVALR